MKDIEASLSTLLDTLKGSRTDAAFDVSLRMRGMVGVLQNALRDIERWLDEYDSHFTNDAISLRQAISNASGHEAAPTRPK